MALPQVTERVFHFEPAWYVRGKRQFASYDNHHHNKQNLALWCAAPPGAQDVLIQAASDRFYRPPYVGGRGWIGVLLDVPGFDWEELAMLIRDAYRTVAPPALAAQA